jgi:hypothetical protein
MLDHIGNGRQAQWRESDRTRRDGPDAGVPQHDQQIQLALDLLGDAVIEEVLRRDAEELA